ncbi:RraA family protein [Ensifer sp. YR511]|uniref:RraA family protein n=1 Tax=Ensifer sp. YR511 TaxID=1855294 RepID=UPI000887BBA8|nr:RraA family protein [Ensifer sp. YR511]SDN41289.1 Regulator of RNase E activity RraA [Ensifer sp. YR511]
MKIDPLVRVTHIADAADELGLSVGSGSCGLQWLGRSGEMAIGQAFTIHQRAVEAKVGEAAPKLLHKDVVSELVQPGDLVVIQVEGATRGATWGEAHAMRARNRGAVGVLIDGLTRDFDGLRHQGFSVLCRGATPFRSVGRLETVSIRSSVEIDGVCIKHGDVVAIDADGFMCLPAENADIILTRASDIARKEQARDNELKRSAL